MPPKKKTKPTPSDNGEDVPGFSVAGGNDGSSTDSDSSVDSQMVGGLNAVTVEWSRVHCIK